MRYWDGVDFFLFVFLGGVALIVIALAWDGWIDRQTFGAQVACETKQMQSRRQYWSYDVVCVPYPLRRDTTTVQVR